MHSLMQYLHRSAPCADRVAVICQSGSSQTFGAAPCMQANKQAGGSKESLPGHARRAAKNRGGRGGEGIQYLVSLQWPVKYSWISQMACI